MRPVRLELDGFAAFREPTVVDFAGAQYFALVGPTGSGKSTVIDAMTFALYGSVPRWDNKAIVSLALAPTATRGTVRLTFEVGAARYVAVRELRRSANGAVTVRNARLERLHDPADPDGETEPLAADGQTTKAVEDLLGLPFEHFCMCVVLPQGEFAQLLHAKPRDRQEMLTRILGMGVYTTIMQRAGAEAGKQKQRAELLDDQLTRYADADDAAVADADRRIEALAALGEQVQEALPGLARADAELTDAQRAAERLRAEGTLLSAVRTPAELPELADRARESAGRTAAARAALADAERADTVARELLDAAPDPAPLHQIRRDHAELAAVIAAAPTLGADLERAIAAATTARSATAEALAASEAARAAVAAAATARDAARAEALRLRAERDRLAEVRVPAEVAALAERHGHAAAELARARAAVAEAEEADVTARAEVAAATRALAGVRARHDELTRADQAAALRSGLVAGEPCPVCDQRVHALPPSAGPTGLADSSAAVQAALDELEQLTKVASAAQDATRAARVTRDGAEAAAADIARRMADAVARFRAVRDPLVAFGAPAPAPDDDLVGSWTALVAWAQDAAADRTQCLAALDPACADDAHTEATRAYTAATDAVQRRRAAEDQALRTEQDARGAVQRAEHRRAQLTQALSGAPSDAEAAERLAEQAELTARSKAADAALRTARAGLAEATRAAEQVGARLRRSWHALAAARDPLVGLGAPGVAAASEDADELVAAWRTLADWAAHEAAQRRGACSEADAAVTRVGQHRAAREGALLDALRAHDLRPPTGRSVAAQAPVLVAAALERARGDAARLRERQAEAARLATRRDQAREAHQVANTLARLLRSDGFPRWLVASALDSLVVDASRRLAELSGGQFELTHEAGEFLVVDHADADARRPVKTLSGGETFQASLALALALSEQLSTLAAAGAARLDSIFLDEGFGTLDEANLDIVAGTLENLASLGDRMVGVVTHVPALAERVPVRFVVSRDQRTASIVREGT